jgi:putative RNA 2'-phosphotransferase
LTNSTRKSVLEAFQSIFDDGEIKKMKRHAVHMQADMSKAKESAKRWHSSEPVVLTIDAHTMYLDGYEFGVTKNDVWLTDHVPTKYISVITFQRKGKCGCDE